MSFVSQIGFWMSCGEAEDDESLVKKRISYLGETGSVHATILPFMLLFACAISILPGCVQPQYYYGTKANGTRQVVPYEGESSNTVAFGGDHPRVDQIERIVQSPRKLIGKGLGFEHGAGEASEPSQREGIILSLQYLTANGLNDVYIDARRYEPAEQWRRLRANDRIVPFWKYTAGALDVAGYTLLPRRALHSDVYSPFTNTLSINSENPSAALYEAARAKEFRSQRWLGTYAVLQRAPFVPLVHHATAASDALTYAQVSDQWELARELYPTTYAKLGSAAVSDAMLFAPLPASAPALSTPLIKLAGMSAGRMVGKLKVQGLESTIDSSTRSAHKPARGQIRN